MEILDMNEFFKKYRIDAKEFEETKLNWELLKDIYYSHVSKTSQYNHAISYVSNLLNDIDKVHSIRRRVKDPEHLIEKIIRKCIKNKELEINLQNYEDIITDLMGIRVLHLFKEDWETIHHKITSFWDTKETPQANIRKGDKEEIFQKNGCDIKEHPFGYRSVHYLIRHTVTKSEQITIEIQVRTVFEEAWSEIDHTIRYPYDIDNPILAGYLVMFNGLSGSADDMGSFIKFLKLHLDNLNTEISEKNKIIDDLRAKINDSNLASEEKETIKSSLEKLSSSRTQSLNISELQLSKWFSNNGELHKSIKAFNELPKKYKGLSTSGLVQLAASPLLLTPLLEIANESQRNKIESSNETELSNESIVPPSEQDTTFGSNKENPGNDPDNQNTSEDNK